jgi:hypothetical protein
MVETLRSAACASRGTAIVATSSKVALTSSALFGK